MQLLCDWKTTFYMSITPNSIFFQYSLNSKFQYVFFTEEAVQKPLLLNLDVSMKAQYQTRTQLSLIYSKKALMHAMVLGKEEETVTLLPVFLP